MEQHAREERIGSAGALRSLTFSAPLLAALAILVVGSADWIPSVIGFNSVEELRVDVSALIRLNVAVLQGARFGVDVIDPYGPLQFVARHLYWPGLYLPRLLGRILHAVALALLLHELLRASGRERILPAVAGALMITWAMLTGLDSVYEFLYLFIVAQRLLSGRTSAATIVAIVAAALMSLVKFSLFALFLATLGTATLIDLLDRRPPWVLVAGLLSFIAFWLMAGERLGDIVPWVTTSLEISSGFSDAMSYGFLEPRRALEIAVLVASIVLVAMSAWRTMVRDRSSLRAIVLMGFVAMWSFVVLKHGIVRHDAHSAHAAGALALALALALVAETAPGRALPARWIAALLGLAFAANVVMVRVELGESVGPVSFLTAMGRAVVAMVVAPVTVPTLAAQHETAVARFRELVGPIPTDQTLDQWPDNPAIAIFSGAPYRPRPLPFADAAYGASISRRNAQFLDDSAGAPKRIAWQVATIDGRLPTFDDSL